MARLKDITGERFGKLVAVSRHGSDCGRAWWLCQCDCGKEVTVAGYSLRIGHTKSCGCLRLTSAPSGNEHYNWKGGRFKGSKGYMWIKDPLRPDKRHRLEHVVIMEQALGRPLYENETVHHINGVRDDNRPENLELWAKKHTPGQRVADRLRDARETIRTYDERKSKRCDRGLNNPSQAAATALRRLFVA